MMTIQDLLKDAYKDGMTLEEINAALSEFKMPEDQTGEIDRLKQALSKSNSEAANYKKQLREKMSADELKEKEDAERREKLQSDYDELLKKVRLSETKSKLLSLGYDSDLAEDTAKALVEGDFDKMFENQKKHLDSVEKQVRADVLKDTPRPTGGNSAKLTVDEIMKIKDSSERQNAIAENIELFKKE